MFENYITNAITEHFGHLVEGLDKDKARLSAWSGELVLNNLNLRRNALDHWVPDCPVEICHGKIGELQVKIPWKLIRSQLKWNTPETKASPSVGKADENDLKCAVVLKNVEILLTPRKRMRVRLDSEESQQETEDVSESHALEEIERSVGAALDKHFLKQVASSPPDQASPTGRASAWIHSRIAEILSSLVVTVQNVHIRYEDPGNCMGFAWNLSTTVPSEQYRPPFSIGAVLLDFSVRSPSTGADEHGGCRRVASARDFSVYWDSNTVLASEVESQLGRSQMSEKELFDEAFRLLASGALPATFPSKVSTQNLFQGRHSFFMESFSPSVELTLAPDDLDNDLSSTTAASTINCILPSCRLNVSRNLLEDVGYLRTSFAIWSTYANVHMAGRALKKLNRFRPIQSPKEAPHEWWRYAFQGVLAFQRLGMDSRTAAIKKCRRAGWGGVAQSIRRRKAYYRLYKCFLTELSKDGRSRLNNELQEVERGLLVDEIVAFRLYTFAILRREIDVDALSREFLELKASDTANDVLTVNHRMIGFLEISHLLGVESRIRDVKSHETPDKVARPFSETSITCPEFGIRLNDQPLGSGKRSPVVHLSFSFLFKHQAFQDGSWEMDNRIGNLLARDCTTFVQSGNRPFFPNLVGPKRGGAIANVDQPSFSIQGESFIQTVLVRIRRDFVIGDSGSIGSKTSTTVRVLPLELVYVTKPVEALNRILRAANTDFADDYQRIVSRLALWRQRQQERLLMALAHKKKDIHISVDLGAPTLLLPEKDDMATSLVAIDLGHIAFNNAESNDENRQAFDNYWKLNITEIQMFSCKLLAYQKATARGEGLGGIKTLRHVIEPFALSFRVATTITYHEDETTFVRVVATLPRLAFNVHSSTIGLLRRLSLQWQERRRETERPSTMTSTTGRVPGANGFKATKRTETTKASFTKVETVFDFRAPLLCVHIENDVDGRDRATCGSTPILDLSMIGIEGGYTSRTKTVGDGMFFYAKLPKLLLKDLYQRAGEDYLYILSSENPSLTPRSANISDDTLGRDLVVVQYAKCVAGWHDEKVTEDWPEPSPDALNHVYFCFHEVYVEWNPETLAALQKAISIRSETSFPSENERVEPDDIFFDAEEDDFHDAESVGSDGDSPLISEIGSSRVSSFTDLRAYGLHARSAPALGNPLLLSSVMAPSILRSSLPLEAEPPPAHFESTPFCITFEMSKLRVNFNKEVRHRRVFTAEMDRTHINYEKRESGYSVNVNIGNLFFTDPAGVESKTLYRELLGLKTDARHPQTSLLKMTYLSKPRRRRYVSTLDLQSPCSEKMVSVDLATGSLQGYDTRIEARLSPMRFVYLQQVWLEIVDYFFEGLMGYEVWGGTRPSPLSKREIIEEASDASVERIGISSYDILLDSPTIMLPVSYCSTDFARFDCKSISVHNFFKRQEMRCLEGAFDRDKFLQWYNSVDVSMSQIELSSSSGSRLNIDNHPINGSVNINWPVGATASVNMPKWHVSCSFDPLTLSLRREDVSLLQSVVGRNIGEDTKHLDEWKLIQALPQGDREEYFKSVIVHFPYDKKDLTPTTFDVSIAVHLLTLEFEGDDASPGPLAVSTFRELVWTYKKYADFIPRQQVKCNVEIIGRESGERSELLVDRPRLVYSSRASPNGDSSRALTLTGPTINVQILSFRHIVDFFRCLPSPTFISPEEFIQIGDRWYSIGTRVNQGSTTHKPKDFSWLPTAKLAMSALNADSNFSSSPGFEFWFRLEKPTLLVRTGEATGTLWMDTFSVTNMGKDGRTKRTMMVEGVECGCSRTKGRQSLMLPWSLTYTLERCDGHKPHMEKISVSNLAATVSFSQLTIGLDIWFFILNELRKEAGSSKHAEVAAISEADRDPPTKRFHVACTGLSLLVCDDSGRHFAGTQELLQLATGMIDFRIEEALRDEPSSGCSQRSKSRHLRVENVDVFDHLQSQTSPFRHVLKVRPQSNLQQQDTGSTGMSHYSEFDEEHDPSKTHGVEVLSLESTIHVYSVIIGHVQFQYNPSMVIALQRFMGRIYKCFQDKDKSASAGASGEAESFSRRSSDNGLSRGTFECGMLVVSLNKEHQGRRILHAEVSSSQLTIKNGSEGSTVEGNVQRFCATVPGGGVYGNPPISVVSSENTNKNLVTFLYKTFHKGRLGGDTFSIPSWLKNCMSVNGELIDDLIDVSISSVQVTLFRTHAEELVDYLSNGMPGKGMGATKRAAKGFVKQRITKRSYFHVEVASPTFFIPVDEGLSQGFRLKVGDVLVESWITFADKKEAVRILKAAVQGMEFGPSREDHRVLHKVDTSIVAEKDSRNLSIATSVSDVTICLGYNDYILLLRVLKGNLMKPVDRNAWDNLEAQWEEESGHLSDKGSIVVFSSDVAYAASARHVRFGGAKKKRSGPKSLSTRASLSLQRMTVRLSRDKEGVERDFLFFAGRKLEVSGEGASEGDFSCSLSLRRIYVLDLGEAWRKPTVSRPRPATIVVEGYSPLEKDHDGETFDSQFVFRVDGGKSRETNVAIVISYLSVALAQNFIVETSNFFKCTWSSPDTVVESTQEGQGIMQQNHATSDYQTEKPKKKLRFVLHYPRFILIADESNQNSRALVLRGLAIANASLEMVESETVTLLNADLQNISSYINPDVNDVLAPRVEHLGMLGVGRDQGLFEETSHESHSSEDLGIPLLLPLTLGMEFEQVVDASNGVEQTVSVNVDPLSIVVGTNDLLLIRSVIDKWSSKSKRRASSKSREKVEVVFGTQKLGVGLKRDEDCIVVDNVNGAAMAKGVVVGDVVHAINGSIILPRDDNDLLRVVEQLDMASRPLSLTLLRCIAPSEASDEAALVKARKTNLDVTFTSAVFSFVEKEFPLLRGELLSSKFVYGLQEDDKGSCTTISLATSVGIKYYNFRMWGWEPLLEHGKIKFSAESQNLGDSVRQLTLEMSDSHDGLALNLTSAAGETLSKLISWSQASSSISEIEMADEDDEQMLRMSIDPEKARKSKVSTAANAALLYARKKKLGSARPFLLRNRTGLSLAFVQESHTERVSSEIRPFLAVGEYPGLERYDSSNISIVGNGQDVKFRVDTNDGFEDETTMQRKFPTLCISLQTVGGVAVEPLRDLEIDRQGEKSLPVRIVELTESRSHKRETLGQGRQHLSWSVELDEEMTTLTLGSSVRIVSLLRSPVDVGVIVSKDEPQSQKTATVKPIGTLYPNSHFFLPVWLGLTEESWCCSMRLSDDHKFVPLFSFSTRGLYDFGPVAKGYVACSTKKSQIRSTWISASVQRIGEHMSITLDSYLSLRNLLPVSVEWEIADMCMASIDGSVARTIGGMSTDSAALVSGEKVEVFTKSDGGVMGRFRPRGLASWSQWVALSITDGIASESKLNGDEDRIGEEESWVVRYAEASDAFGLLQTFAVRISLKDCGLDVTLCAEFWLMNCTSLDITFGCTWPQKYESIKNIVIGQDELSAAEAALKEITTLFDGGKEVTKAGHATGNGFALDLIRIASQNVAYVLEEFFEYLEIGGGTSRRWWASDNPFHGIEDPSNLQPRGAPSEWFWADKEWEIDRTGSLSSEGWESSQSLNSFSQFRNFNRSHRFRRRRWTRRRGCPGLNQRIIPGIQCYYQPRREGGVKTKGEKTPQIGTRIGIQVGGGLWAVSAAIPLYSDKVYGAIRASGTRWPDFQLREKRSHGHPVPTFELCYSIAALDGAWGDFSRLVMVSSRFLLRNNSKTVSFEVKQTGTDNKGSIIVEPGEQKAFHWADSRRPELISVRPQADGRFRWSGGFDPLTIGTIPLRVHPRKSHNSQYLGVTSIKMDAEIRRKTGGTGINLSFEEEDGTGDGALFRLENRSNFPLWISQDGVLANPSGDIDDLSGLEGSMLRPFANTCFALDVPFRQGKYTGRKAASLSELLRIRLALAPLNSRSGIETTKVVSLAEIGAKVKLNPAKLTFLKSNLRTDLDRVRIMGVVTTEGPTTVLSFCLIEKDSDNLLVNPFSLDETLFEGHIEPSHMSPITQTIVAAAKETATKRLEEKLPTELHVLNKRLYKKTPRVEAPSHENDLQISVRVSIRGLVLSLVDSAPSEIGTLTFRNINAIASWNVLRSNNAAIIFTVTDLQMDNMLPNAPFPVAISPESKYVQSHGEGSNETSAKASAAPVLVAGVSFAPRHKTGIVCLRSVTIAPQDLALRVDLAFLVRLQKFALEVQGHFYKPYDLSDDQWPVPNISGHVEALETAAQAGVGEQKNFFSSFNILPHNVKLSVAPARALSGPQAVLEGSENSAIHQAVRKGDVKLDRSSAGLFGVSVGRTNTTALAVLRGVFKSIVVDALLRLDGASINFGGVSLRNHIATRSQLFAQLGVHYVASLRHNVPALLGSLAAIGNPIGLARGLGDGVSDMFLEPVKGFQKSVQEMNASHLVDGVARGTMSLARHTVGGFADSAAMLTETFSKNMVVLTLDRRYAQKRDRVDILRDQEEINVALGLGSGVQKLVTGFLEGVTGVVKAPIRGAEKKGLEGFAKGIGKGLLGLLVKPIIGISDGIADVMIGVKGTVDGASGVQSQLAPLRPRRAFYGRQRVMRPYNMEDAAASALLMRTRLAGDLYLNHHDMGDRLVLLSVRRLILLGSQGQELLLVRLKHIERLEVRFVCQEDIEWSLLIFLNTPRKNGSEVEVVVCPDEKTAHNLKQFIERGVKSLGGQLRE